MLINAGLNAEPREGLGRGWRISLIGRAALVARLANLAPASMQGRAARGSTLIERQPAVRLRLMHHSVQGCWPARNL